MNAGAETLGSDPGLLLIAPAPPPRRTLDHLEPPRKAIRRDVYIAVHFDVHSRANTRSFARSGVRRQEGIGVALTDIREQYEKQLKDLQEAYGEAMLELRARKSWRPSWSGRTAIDPDAP